MGNDAVKRYAPADKPIDAWIITDQDNLRQSAFAQAGMSYVHLHEKLHCKQQLRYMIGMMSVQRPKLLWIRLGGPHSGSGNKHDNVRANNLMQIAQLQIRSGRALILEANSRSLAWSLQHVQDVVQHLNVNKYAWCGIENSVEQTQPPCNTIVQIATNLVGLGSVVCECSLNTAHISRKQLPTEDFHRRRQQVLGNIWHRAVRIMNDRTLSVGVSAPAATHNHSQSESFAVDAPGGAPATATSRKRVSFEISGDSFAKGSSASLGKQLSFSVDSSSNQKYSGSEQLAADTEQKAVDAMMRKDFSFKTCLEILNPIPLNRHPTTRAATAADESSSCFVFGLFKHGAEIGITSRSERFPQTTKFLNKFGAHHGAIGQWTSISINFNSQLDMHWDFGNLRGSLNQLIGLGNYQRGQLWVELFPDELSSHQNVKWMTSDQGDMMTGCLMHCKHRMIRFEPERRHATMEWAGNSVTLSFYVNRGIVDAGQSILERLGCLGFPLSRQSHLAAVVDPVAHDAQCSYPTEQALRRREVLKKGHQPKKKKQVVEQHADDCGDSLDSILPDVEAHHWTPALLGSLDEATDSLQYFAKADEVFAQVSANMLYHGSGCKHPHSRYASNGVCTLDQLMFMSSGSLKESEIHLIEIFGNSDSGLYLLSKGFHVQMHRNFDVVARVDLRKPNESERLRAYFNQTKPAVALISPYVDLANHRQTSVTASLGRVCYQIANDQLARGCHILLSSNHLVWVCFSLRAGEMQTS